MKAETYILANDNVRRNAIMRINELVCDGSVKLTISDAGSKSTRQRSLQWMWYTEIANSGIGGKHEDSKEGVHLVCKYLFARPIFIRDDSFFCDLWNSFKTLYGDDPDRVEWFIDNVISTEKFNTSQMAEYLTDVQRHYTSKGVTLTDPDDRKLLEYDSHI